MVEVTQADIALWADLLAATDNEGTVVGTDAVVHGMIAAHRQAGIFEGTRLGFEAAALWYEETSWQTDEDAVPGLIRTIPI